MKCPNCKKEIETVLVESSCTQRAQVEGKQIIEYGSVNNIGKTLHISCLYCDHDLKEELEE